MCKSLPTINRKSVMDCIKRAADDKAPITGRDVRDCAVEVAAQMGGYPDATAKVEEIIKDQLARYCLTLHDAILTPLDPESREALLRDEQQAAARKAGARERSIQQREVRRLKAS